MESAAFAYVFAEGLEILVAAVAHDDALLLAYTYGLCDEAGTERVAAEKRRIESDTRTGPFDDSVDAIGGEGFV